MHTQSYLHNHTNKRYAVVLTVLFSFQYWHWWRELVRVATGSPKDVIEYKHEKEWIPPTDRNVDHILYFIIADERLRIMFNIITNLRDILGIDRLKEILWCWFLNIEGFDNIHTVSLIVVEEGVVVSFSSSFFINSIAWRACW